MSALTENKAPTQRDIKSQLSKSLEELSDKEQLAIFLRFWGPCSIEEVSREMHISWSQADRLVESALEKLRTDFEKYGISNFKPEPNFFNK